MAFEGRCAVPEGYDVIGDVHGSASQLDGLLEVLGYQRNIDDVWAHPDRRVAVFVGDIIDRGPGQLRALRTVRAMVEAGTGLMVIGNHEYNAVCYATPHAGSHLRERSPKNHRQHERFLEELPIDSAEHGEWIAWFRTLPMWLDLDGLRVVHACWSDLHIEMLAAAFGGPTLCDDDALICSATIGEPEYEAVELILKGPEVSLPENLWYLDKDGHLRRNARYRWWSDGDMTLRERAVFVPGCKLPDGSEHLGFDDTPVESPVPGHNSGQPVIVGHYWEQGTPELLSPHVACVDYSAVKGGDLVAYRWSGESQLTRDHFVGFAAR
jgi:hypothetical protein